jgi:peptidyl-prolyl cis-trans isomerase SurA
MPEPRSRRTRFGAVVVTLAGLTPLWLAAACRSTATPASEPAAVSPDTWAVVDGQEIRREDVEKGLRRLQDPALTMSEDEALMAKLNLLDDMITQEILLKRAAEQKLEVPESELNAAYESAKENITDEAFQEELTKRNLTPADMRLGLRRQLLAQKVIDQAVGASLAVTDQEVSDFFAANRAQFNIAEESYHIGQIVVTPAREAQLTNTSGDDATTPQAAATKVNMLMEKLKGGASFQELAVTYSEDPETAPRGGDLGLVPVSRLRQAPAALRNAVLNRQPGTVSVASETGGYTLVLVVAHELAGQRELSTPGVRDSIIETLRAQKTQLRRAAYVAAARADADVVNYLARRLAEAPPGAAPTLQPTPPGQN